MFKLRMLRAATKASYGVVAWGMLEVGHVIARGYVVTLGKLPGGSIHPLSFPQSRTGLVLGTEILRNSVLSGIIESSQCLDWIRGGSDDNGCLWPMLGP